MPNNEKRFITKNEFTRMGIEDFDPDAIYDDEEFNLLLDVSNLRNEVRSERFGIKNPKRKIEEYWKNIILWKEAKKLDKNKKYDKEN